MATQTSIARWLLAARYRWVIALQYIEQFRTGLSTFKVSAPTMSAIAQPCSPEEAHHSFPHEMKAVALHKGRLDVLVNVVLDGEVCVQVKRVIPEGCEPGYVA